MGSRMARQFIDGGFELRGFDVDADRSVKAEKMGVEIAGSPAEAAVGCWDALLSVPNSGISREVCLGDGGLIGSRMSPRYVFGTTRRWASATTMQR